MSLADKRHLFPTTTKWAFLDHAAVAPLPAAAAAAMKEYADDMAINGVASFHKWDDRIHTARRIAGELLNAEPLDVAFVPNTTAGIGIVAEGFPWQHGDNLIAFEEEYPSNQYPWMNLRDRGVEVRRVKSRGNRIAIDDIRAAFDARTRLLTLSAVEFASGFRSDLIAIGDICRANNAFFFVDAIQALGVIPFDVQNLPIDALAADGHKWLLGPEGAGLFWIRREWVDRLRTIGVGWNSVVGAHDFGTIDFRLKPHAGRWEGGTANAAGIVGLAASMRLLLDEGIANVWGSVRKLTDHLCERAPQFGLDVFSSRVVGEQSGIVSLVPKNDTPIALKKKCDAAGIAVNVRGGRLRVSPHAYNTVEEIDRFLSCVG